MKVSELIESDLDGFQEVLLMKHGKLSREKAQELAKKLKEMHFFVSNKHVPANLRWKLDEETGALKFVSAEMPGSWRAGSSAAGRGRVLSLLKSYGFEVGRVSLHANSRTENTSNGPHIYFWGPGTPPKGDA